MTYLGLESQSLGLDLGLECKYLRLTCDLKNNDSATESILYRDYICDFSNAELKKSEDLSALYQKLIPVSG